MKLLNPNFIPVPPKTKTSSNLNRLEFTHYYLKGVLLGFFLSIFAYFYIADKKF